MIDKDEKNTNDKTWCFWETGESEFESIVTKSWSNAEITGENYKEVFDISPYRYKMIRSKNYYDFAKSLIKKYPGFHYKFGEAEIQNEDNTAYVKIDNLRVDADWIFNSVLPQNYYSSFKTKNFLLQHFRGWFIRTPEKAFQPDEIKLMDFNTHQNGDTRFFYVLPLNENEALIEYTIFSPAILEQSEYEKELNSYIKKNLKIESFEITHDEFGVIPMTDHAFTERPFENLINIGTAGGDTKPSTGYTFNRIQERTSAIVSALEKNKSPEVESSLGRKKYKLYDSTLLNVLVNNLYPGDELFIRLFKRNGAVNVLNFLDEKSTFKEDMKLFNTTPRLIFMKAMLKELTK